MSGKTCFPEAGKKRGQLSSQTVLIVAALFLGVVMLLFSKPFIGTVQAQDFIEACRASVNLASFQVRLDIWVREFNILDGLGKLDCKTLFTTVTKDDIKSADYTEKLTDENRKDLLKELVMKRMRECWYMFGEGKAKIYQAEEIDEEQARCFVCSEIKPEKEFIEKYDGSPLPDLYTYSAQAFVPPKEEKSYLDYFLENSDNRPDTKVIPKKNILLKKQYSVVYAITKQVRKGGLLFQRGSTLPQNAGIVDCYVGGHGKVTGDDARAIGCNEKGESPDSLIFGMVMDGGTDVDIGFTDLIKKMRYPATVRLVPTDQLTQSCRRIY